MAPIPIDPLIFTHQGNSIFTMEDDRQYAEVDRMRWLLTHRLRILREEIALANAVFVIEIGRLSHPCLVSANGASSGLVEKIKALLLPKSS